MNWVVFIAGVIVGWIVEWLIDLLFWRQRQKKWVAAESEYQTRLADLNAELEGHKERMTEAVTLETDLSSVQTEADELREQLAAAEAERTRLSTELAAAQAERTRLNTELSGAAGEIDRLGAELASAEAERQSLTERFADLSGLAIAAPAAAGAALVAMSRGEAVDLEALGRSAGDDLTMIEGVGPKIQELLYQNDIRTYAELAESDVERLKEILAAGGGSFRMADPSSWPRQARLAAAADWVRLQSLKEQLTGGVRRPAAEAPPPPDDLTMIEGVGPKIQELLNQHGIRTFADLAESDPEALKAILVGGGAAFRLADPSSWPRQARLAATGDWVRLQSLKEQLTGGVRRPEAEAPPPPDDDLTMIEGIGPKVAATLQERGIRTFDQLAQADVAHLKAILADGGPALALAAQAAGSWPEQARLAAASSWDELRALKDSLKAGRAEAE